MSTLSNSSVEATASALAGGNRSPDATESDVVDQRAESREPGGKPIGPASSKRRTTTVWVWNLPLLAVSLALVVLGVPTLVGLYYWQSTRVGAQLMQLADLAVADQNPNEEAQWLRRYLSLRPDDVDAQVRFAWSYDSRARKWAEIDQSRRHLTRALIAVDGSGDSVTEDALRRRLIERHLQLGGSWFIEAERQLMKLNPPPEEPLALGQLAKSLLGQNANQVPRPTLSDSVERTTDFWRWAANQPLGEVLRMAVEANPDSVELSAALIGAYLDRPQWFAGQEEALFSSVAGAVAGKRDVEQASRLIQKLSDRQDNGYAQWVAFYYGNRDQVTVQLPPLALVAASALQRLQDQAESVGANGEVNGPMDANAPDAYLPYWDAQLVLIHAGNLAAAQAFSAAQDNYESLVALPEAMLVDSQLEASFLGLGQSLWLSGEQEAAHQAWNTGNQRLGGANLALLTPLAATSVQTLPVDDARQSVSRLAEAVQSMASRLAARTDRDASQRGELQAQLNTATWRIDVLHAQLDYREGKHRQAAHRLERAIASQLDVETQVRVEAAELLAAAYGELKLWDLAGRALDEAALLVPGDRVIRRRAAAAWQRADSASRAAEQWQRADDGSFESALAYAGAIASGLTAKAPANQDPKPLLAAIKEAQRRLERVGDSDGEPAESWRLELLSLSLPPELRASRSNPDSLAANDADIERAGDGTSTEIDELLDLSLQFPNAVQLQAVTALALQRGGDAAAADEAVQRLVSISDVDPLIVLEVQSRLAIQRGEIDEAVKLLQDASKSDVGNASGVTPLAARFLRAMGRQREAVELLRKLEPGQHDPDSLLQWGELLLALRQPEEGQQSGSGAEQERAIIDETAELQRVEDLLRQAEGDEGTHWRLLAAERLLQQLDTDSSEKRRRLAQAAILQAEIISRRPRWSRGLALGGQIAALQGDARRSIELLRRAIAEGDKGAATVLTLVRQLNRLGDVAAAEQELGRLENLTDSIGQISTLSVGLALGQGNYDRALQRARSGVAARPNDAEALLVLAQAAAAVARTDEEQAELLRSEADDALRRAIELTRGRNLGVWQAQIRFQAETGGDSAAGDVLLAMEQSELPDRTRYLALANGYLALKDWDQAQSWLEKAKQVNPSDVGVAMTQVALFRATRQNEAMMMALEEAHRLAPHREDIRRQLALALAASPGTEVPWERITQLVGAERQDSTHTDQLFHSLILISRGDQGQIERARGLLRDLLLTDNAATVDDATRLLLGVERSRWETVAAAGERDKAATALAECRRLYESLVRRSNPNPMDLYGYGELLLKANQVSEAKEIADRLTRVAPVSRGTLDLHLRLAKAKSKADPSELTAIVDAWLQQPGNGKSFEAVATAGQVLVDVDLMQQALQLLSDAYQHDPGHLRNYVVALARNREFQRAISVCLDHFHRDRSPEPVALLADVMVQGIELSLGDENIEEVLVEAVKEFSSHVQLLESIGTLRLTQQRYTDAVALFTKSEKLNPISLVTLNNMAVALAEIPGRHAEALVRIERAIELYGRDPELLDTLGVVQLQGNLLTAAEATLRDAYARSNEPRHLFHLLLVLDARQQSAEVQQLWKQLDLRSLNTSALSPRDQEQLKNLKRRLGQSSAT